jgi:hypothetical protein
MWHLLGKPLYLVIWVMCMLLCLFTIDCYLYFARWVTCMGSSTCFPLCSFFTHMSCAAAHLCTLESAYLCAVCVRCVSLTLVWIVIMREKCHCLLFANIGRCAFCTPCDLVETWSCCNFLYCRNLLCSLILVEMPYLYGLLFAWMSIPTCKDSLVIESP